MGNPNEPDISRLTDALEKIDSEFANAMRARGFDPAQEGNVALPSSLANLYQEREELRDRLKGLGDYGGSRLRLGENKMSELASRDCVPCRGGVPPMKGDQLVSLQSQLTEWDVVNEHHLRKEYKFKDFKQTQDFVNRVGDLAEQQWHHPDICFGWGRAEVTIWTHKIDGLTESDFILAAKIDGLVDSSDSGSPPKE